MYLIFFLAQCRFLPVFLKISSVVFGGGGEHPVYQEIQYIAPEILFKKEREKQRQRKDPKKKWKWLINTVCARGLK